MARPITRFHWVHRAGSIKRGHWPRVNYALIPQESQYWMVSQDSPVWQRVWIGSLASPVSLCSIVSPAHVSTTSSTTRDSSAVLVLNGKLGKASAVHWYKPLSLPRFIRLCKTRQTAVWPRLPATGNVSFTVLPRWFYCEHMQCQFYWQSVSQAPICSSIHIHPPSSPSHIGSHRPTCTLFTGVLNLRQNGSRKRAEAFRK